MARGTCECRPGFHGPNTVSRTSSGAFTRRVRVRESSRPAGTSRPLADAVRLRHEVVEADERAAADEQDVGRVDVMRILQLDLRTFHDLQQRVLDAFAGDPARLLASLELVDLVDEDDAVLRLVDVAAGLVDEALEDGLDLVVDVTRLGERSRLRRDEGH